MTPLTQNTSAITIIAEAGAVVNVNLSTDSTEIAPPDQRALIERMAEHKKAAQEINKKLAAYYRSHGQAAKAGNLITCGSYMNLRSYHDPKSTTRLSGANFCKHPLCLMCAWRRSVKWGQRLTAAIGMLYAEEPKTRLYHLILTQPNTPHITKEQVKFLKQQGVAFIRKYIGTGSYVMSLEITCKAKGYHPHLHCMIDMGDKELDTSPEGIAALRKAWRQYMPSPYDYTIAALYPVTDLNRAASELCKYILSTDGSDLWGAKLGELAEAIHSVRQQSAAGRLNRLIQAATVASELAAEAEIAALEAYGYTDTLYRWLAGHYVAIADRSTSDDPDLNDEDWVYNDDNNCSALHNPFFDRRRSYVNVS